MEQRLLGRPRLLDELHSLVTNKRGELLSRASTARLLRILAQVRTGPQRLRGGLAPGWSIGHKTGSGQIFNGVQAGYNDIGILTSPGGRHYAVAVMIGRTAAPNLRRMELMQDVTRAVIAYDGARGEDEREPPRIPYTERDDDDNEVAGKTY